eukprot:417654-Amphidinium_carterae.2
MDVGLLDLHWTIFPFLKHTQVNIRTCCAAGQYLVAEEVLAWYWTRTRIVFWQSVVSITFPQQLPPHWNKNLNRGSRDFKRTQVGRLSQW